MVEELAQGRSFKRDEDDLPCADARAPQPVNGFVGFSSQAPAIHQRPFSQCTASYPMEGPDSPRQLPLDFHTRIGFSGFSCNLLIMVGAAGFEPATSTV